MSLGVASFDERYRAVAARDRRFDGQFVLAVRTTGIYCRPSCPARTPLAHNVEFFATSAAAHDAGFRACKRCLPEATPGSPDWDIRRDVVGRVMRLIADGVVERDGVPALASRVGYSTRHLNRLLLAELGAGALALARAHRAHTARLLLTHTELSATDVAFAAGFGSVRQFNETIREVFALTPSELRQRSTGAAVVPGAISLELAVREPFDGDGLMRWMAARAIEGMEQATPSSFTRTLRLPHGTGWFTVRIDGSPVRVRLEAQVAALADLGPLVSRVRRLFDLDADPVAIDAQLARHPQLSEAVARVPGIRVPRSCDPHEMLIRAMVGQQISVAAARTVLSHLVAELGEPVAASEGQPALLFPTMATIAEEGARVLRGPAARVRAVVTAAAGLADGTLPLTAVDDPVEQRDRLLAHAGIGPWTADYVRMRVLGDPDVLLPGDLAARAGAARLGIPAAAAELDVWAERVAPWRSYLTAHLWRANDFFLSTTTPRSTT